MFLCKSLNPIAVAGVLYVKFIVPFAEFTASKPNPPVELDSNCIYCVLCTLCAPSNFNDVPAVTCWPTSSQHRLKNSCNVTFSSMMECMHAQTNTLL